jgi:putative alpha-1,2-mannosidase
VTGVTPTATSQYVEGDAYEYLWNVPNNYASLFSLLGGNAKVAPELRQYVFATTVPVDSSKTVASVTFPSVSSQIGSSVTAMHILAVSAG